MFQLVRNVGSFLQKSTHILCNTSLLTSNSLPAIDSTFLVRTKIRDNFPRAKETYRIKKLGWKARLSYNGGRRLIWRRILKGKHVLTH
ncbi:hypothetical protein PVAND_009798 [Polypedilum vanderplanki]|uniref:39S ribosomal protein L34, mitochondrial n=1 Tax=Polypedilum vanderplanki TaxID=319348 RepID=A0A9J6CEN3_POLVA|nr:hypothetical protein PVAND_009798 [Polypedilum vanderplanki]